MNIYEEYNYYIGFIHHLKELLYNKGFQFDEKHGWFNYYNRPLSKKEKNDIDENIKKFNIIKEHLKEIKKKIDN